jgi:hypothetical protein
MKTTIIRNYRSKINEEDRKDAISFLEAKELIKDFNNFILRLSDLREIELIKKGPLSLKISLNILDFNNNSLNKIDIVLDSNSKLRSPISHIYTFLDEFQKNQFFYKTQEEKTRIKKMIKLIGTI